MSHILFLIQRFLTGLLCLLAVITSLPAWAQNETVKLKVAHFAEAGKDGAYYRELIESALSQAGYDYEIITSPPYPQKRVIQMLEKGDVTIAWMLPTAERDADYTRVPVPITNGLISKRVLLIPEGRQAVYDQVRDLDSFRALDKVAAIGKTWYDRQVWEHNRLPVMVFDGDWTAAFRPLAQGNRGIDYFPRGANEIIRESHKYPGLDIEKNLLLQYQSDFYFYLSHDAKAHVDAMTNSMERARSSGLIDRLIEKYWGEDLAELNLSQRRVIPLDSPPDEVVSP
ncbi:conserved hypothetical protein [Hahella chejuensis KCTC 2396]|uniref:ABC-type amino acid transport/signal transduction systems, periplasmic component/domain n=1 Tax=Hahella chejuensis (strain KCTC 2396) TaxID=349521 RepID=Q2SCZ3_HAHCH|nr:transporter substrate-binding domain-containing protein [Hahella chejuensis]ABC31481.1 conserved hypothetical protein [Hahella chejuensis KCTC 2396]